MRGKLRPWVDSTALGLVTCILQLVVIFNYVRGQIPRPRVVPFASGSLSAGFMRILLL